MYEPSDLDSRALLDAAVERRQADLLVLAAHWADLHAVLPGRWRSSRPELGAAQAVSSHAAAPPHRDALKLRHRLPRLWRRVQNGRLQAWRARQVAGRTKCLSRTAAASPLSLTRSGSSAGGGAALQTGGWSHTMPEPGLYLWRSPLGRRYVFDHTGSTSLDRPA